MKQSVKDEFIARFGVSLKYNMDNYMLFANEDQNTENVIQYLSNFKLKISNYPKGMINEVFNNPDKYSASSEILKPIKDESYNDDIVDFIFLEFSTFIKDLPKKYTKTKYLKKLTSIYPEAIYCRIKNIPKEFYTLEFTKFILKQCSSNLSFIPDRLKTQEVERFAMLKSPALAYEYLKNPTYEYALAAVREYALNINDVESKYLTEELILIALKGSTYTWTGLYDREFEHTTEMYQILCDAGDGNMIKLCDDHDKFTKECLVSAFKHQVPLSCFHDSIITPEVIKMSLEYKPLDHTQMSMLDRNTSEIKDIVMLKTNRKHIDFNEFEISEQSNYIKKSLDLFGLKSALIYSLNVDNVDDHISRKLLGLIPDLKTNISKTLSVIYNAGIDIPLEIVRKLVKLDKDIIFAVDCVDVDTVVEAFEDDDARKDRYMLTYII